jgi:hypothetical protein
MLVVGLGNSLVVFVSNVSVDNVPALILIKPKQPSVPVLTNPDATILLSG